MLGFLNKAIKKTKQPKPAFEGLRKKEKSRRLENVGFKEASTGFEPVNDGFAIRCLSRLATTP